MANIASKAGARILFVNTPSNLKDCSPFKSEFSSHLNAIQKNEFQAFLQTGKELAAQGNYAEALDQYRQAQELDGRHSHLHYRTGKALYALGRYKEAEHHLIISRDEDICPLRALSPIIGIMDEVSTTGKVPMIDWNAFLKARAMEEKGNSILGEEEFLDHVHLTIESHRLLALEIISRLSEEKMFNIPADWKNRDLNALTEARLNRVDRKTHGIALHNLAKVMNWAGKIEDAVPVAEKALYLDSTSLEAVGSSLLAGAALHRRNRLEDAMNHYQRAYGGDPNNIQVNRFMGMVYKEWKEDNKAVQHFEKVLGYEPEDLELHQELGHMYFRLKQPRKALDHFTFLVSRKPKSPNLRFNLGLALYKLDRKDEAAQQWQQVLQLNPEHRGAYEGLMQLRMERGLVPPPRDNRISDEARKKALENLQKALKKEGNR
jgi:tetratricopeptide (TPR) repeat protein